MKNRAAQEPIDRMHELSIIQTVVASAIEEALEAKASRVHCVTMRVGVLAGVVKESLLFCYEVASQGTSLEGSRLEIQELPLVIYCTQCRVNRELPGIQSFRCPACGTLSGEVRQGRELELTSIEIE